MYKRQVALWFAAKALSTWRAELRASAEHEVALRCLGVALQLESAIAGYREPTRWGSDFPKEGVLRVNLALLPFNAEREEYAFESRRRLYFEPLANELERVKVEGWILWGEQFKTRFEALTDCLSSLRSATDEFLWRAGHSREAERVNNARFTEVWGVVHASKDHDEFEKKVAASRRELENFLLPRVATRFR